jgi:hypothetical protein
VLCARYPHDVYTVMEPYQSRRHNREWCSSGFNERDSCSRNRVVTSSRSPSSAATARPMAVVATCLLHNLLTFKHRTHLILKTCTIAVERAPQQNKRVFNPMCFHKLSQPRTCFVVSRIYRTCSQNHKLQVPNKRPQRKQPKNLPARKSARS